MKKKQKGFALVLSLVLLLAMSLMGGALIVIASSDHQGNNSSDEYQQTFYVAETALLQAQKSLIDKILGPIDNSGQRSSNRSIPRNTLSIDPINYGNRSSLTPCYKSFRNLSRALMVYHHLKNHRVRPKKKRLITALKLQRILIIF